MPRPSLRLISDAVNTQLGTLSPAIDIYRGEVTDSPAIVPQSGRIAPYLVFYTFGPADVAEGDLADAPTDVTYTIQVDCVAGFEADCAWVVEQVVGKLDRWAPTVAGMVVGRLKPPTGYDPGPFRRDDAVKPSRFSLPLQYRTTATATT